MDKVWSWLESSGIAVAMREWTWLYPIVEIAHIWLESHAPRKSPEITQGSLF